MKIEDKDYRLVNRLRQLLKTLKAILINDSVQRNARYKIIEACDLIEYLLEQEQCSLSLNAVKLKNEINNALIENKHGDGVAIWVLKSKTSKIEKCSLLKFYINED